MNEFAIPTRYGALAGVLHRPENKLTDVIMVICHGFRGSKDGGGRAVRLAELAAKSGVTVVRFDFTHLARLSRQVEEITDVVKFCRQNLGKNIILLGRSMGGSAALAFAARDQTIVGLCLWATPWNLTETFQLALGSNYKTLVCGHNLVIDDEYGHLELTPAFIQDFANFNLLASIKVCPPVPLLLVHGSADEIVPLAQAEKIYQTARDPKEMVVIDGADHHFINHADQAAAAVINWLQRRFLPSGI